MQQLKSSGYIVVYKLCNKSINNRCSTSIICIYNSIKRYSTVAEIIISQLASLTCSVLEKLISQLISDYSICNLNFVVNHKIATNKDISS